MNKLALTILVCLPVCAFAESLTLTCPPPSEITKTGDHWTGVIPATSTQEGSPISSITMLSEAVPTNDTLTALYGIGIVVDRITCSYTTSAGNMLSLTGSLKEVSAIFDLPSNCKLPLGAGYTLVCNK